MLRSRELLKHTSVREPVAWSGLVLVFQHPEVKLAAPFGLWSSIKLLFAAHSTKHSPLDVLALYPHCTCWQLKSPAYTHEDGNTRRDVVKRHEDGGLLILIIFSPATSLHKIESQNIWETDWLVSRTGSHGQMWLNCASCLVLTLASAKFGITS